MPKCGPNGGLWHREWVVAVAILSSPLVALNCWGQSYPWTNSKRAPETVSERFEPPPGFERGAFPAASFAAWLRRLPLKPHGSQVKLFNGENKPRQDVHAAVIDIDVGNRDLQQCADAVMRLRAEWLFASGMKDEIAFNFTGGGRVPFWRFAKGQRPDESGLHWLAKAKTDDSYASFRRYMDYVFAFAGTASLEKELTPVPVSDIRTGDVFIKGGFPGHAVIVADLVENKVNKAKRFLLIQSYMPAQDMHVLKNPANSDGSPWYVVPEGDLITPEWTFQPGALRRWP
jgi:Domain of unknown function (4846)